MSAKLLIPNICVTYVNDTDVIDHILDVTGSMDMPLRTKKINDVVNTDESYINTSVEGINNVGKFESDVGKNLFDFNFKTKKKTSPEGTNEENDAPTKSTTTNSDETNENIPSIRRSTRKRKARIFSDSFEVPNDSSNKPGKRTENKIDWSVLRDRGKVLKHSQEEFHEKVVKKLEKEFEESFPKWLSLLKEDFNVILYGIGSKRELLEKFRRSQLQGEFHVVVEGYFPRVSLIDVLRNVAEFMFHIDISSKQVSDYFEAFESKESFISDLFLIIHNIDGPTLRLAKNQKTIADLSKLRGIHIIASVDHINAPSLWSSEEMNSLQWLWFKTSTWRSYRVETSFENSMISSRQACTDYSSLMQVLNSLTPNAKKIFVLLARDAAANQDNLNFKGTKFTDLYNDCYKAFIVSNENSLRTHLNEFKDHNLVSFGKNGPTSRDIIKVLIDNDSIEQFLNENNEKFVD